MSSRRAPSAGLRRAALAVLVAASSLLGGCANPPQIQAISPGRGAAQVATNAPVTIHFDRPMDRASVESRFRLDPKVEGTFSWTSPQDLVFAHRTLATSSAYWVRLGGGYRDVDGNANGLDHAWSFRTEAPPELVGASPAMNETGVDPAAYIALTFSREMDPATLPAAISISPGVAVTVRTDPADAHRVVLAPGRLLDPGRRYAVTVTRDARDVDGNALFDGVSVTFATGELRPLRHWITFTASDGELGTGVYVVDEQAIPRQLAALPARRATWAPGGDRLLVRTDSGAWNEVSAQGQTSILPLRGGWAGLLAAGRGWAELADGVLSVVDPAGTRRQVAVGVGEAAVAPGGRQVAFTVPAAGGSELRAYDIDLRAQYRLQAEPTAIDTLGWAPDGSAISYRLPGPLGGRTQLRVRSLRGSGATTTVAIGDLESPSWADPSHLVFSAFDPGGARGSRIYRVSAAEVATRAVDPALGLPARSDLDARDPSPSPDGHQVAFRARVAGVWQLWVMNADGTGLLQLTSAAAGFPYSCSAPGWTPS